MTNQDSKDYDQVVNDLASDLVEAALTENGGLLETVEMKREKMRQLIEKELNTFESDFLEGYEILLKQLESVYMNDSKDLPKFSIKI